MADGLLCGLTPYLIRILCENPFEGGAGYTPAQVGDMTLDQVYMRLADKKVLRSRPDARTTEVEPIFAGDGLVKGRAADGTPIQGTVTGISKAAKIAAAQAAERSKKQGRRRGRRRGGV